MARAGMQRWRNPAPEGDDVQRSIELLDKVLSEYDEHDADGEGGDNDGCVGNGSGRSIVDCGSNTEPNIGFTPSDESSSLGHQSEDDGYMSMNGRKAKMALVALRPVPDCPEPQDLAGASTQEFPPPPEEAERIISTLLPMVSPGNSSKRNVMDQLSERRINVGDRQQWMVEDNMHHENVVTTQTTLPKTRHQRPYGWENGTVESLQLAHPLSPPRKFASLPYDSKVSFNWIPPHTNPSKVEKHREVCRHSSEEYLGDGSGGYQHQSSLDHVSYHLRKQQRQQNEIMKSCSVEDRLLMNRLDKESTRRSRNNSDSSEGRFSRNSESESRSSIPRSSSVSVERFSMRANCDSSDFSRANSTSNERFHSDFSIAVASASSNDHVSVPTSEPFSIRNLDFVSFVLPDADSSERFSAPTSDRCSEERYSDLFSTRNSDFSARNSADFRTQSEEERFSDDSLEELLPPPPPISKRHSIAWEVSLEDDPLYAPGSTKVVGRRRRKSSDVSSVDSASKLRDFDDWQDQRLSTTDDDLISPYSDSSMNDLDQIRSQELTKNGTYVIRHGHKKERKVLLKPTKTKSLFFENGGKKSQLSDVKRYSSTFDNIKSLLKENKLEDLNEPHAEFEIPMPPPDLIRVVSMPAINNDAINRTQLEITVEAEEIFDVSDKDKKHNHIEIFRLSPSSIEDQMDRLDRSRDCNGVPTAPNLSDLNIGRSSANSALSEMTKEKLSYAVSYERLASKIPVNLLIEDQIVKKALKENRRQLEKVSDAIKKIENVKNSESYCESKRWRNGDLKQSSKRNSFENEFLPIYNSRKPMTVDGSPYNGKTHGRQHQQQQQQYSSDSETSKASSDADFVDRRKLNGATDVVYSSSRRLRQNGTENHKNDQKQIEHVIDAILEDSKNPEFQVNLDIMEFPPLPPSPVEEADEENCSDIGQSAVMTSPKSKSYSSNRTVEYRPRVPPHRVPPIFDPKEQISLNTKSMDAGFAKGRRTPTTNNFRREIPVERRTLPNDLPGPSRRRPFMKRHSPSAETCSSGGSSGGGIGGCVGTGTGSGMQTSCSLPETPVFARGSDIPRTPQHTGNPTQSKRQSGWCAPTTATSYRRNNPGLEQAIIGTELLRLAGGPNRGWYPTRKANQPRPASIEHLERLNNAYDARLPSTGDQRKPLTLPTNITPNKYFGQSKHSSASSTREALRRVTSLLIKKGFLINSTLSRTTSIRSF